MPDILTHLAVTHFVSRTPNLYKNRLVNFYMNYRAIIYIGALLPDLFSKPFQYITWKIYNFGLALHSPFCVIIECFLFSQLFYIKSRKTTFLTLLSFSMFHIFIDSLQEGVNPGYQLLFPFALRRYGINMVNTEMYLYSLCILVAIGLITEYFLFRKKQHQIKSNKGE
jgi:hypothetical protein